MNTLRRFHSYRLTIFAVLFLILFGFLTLRLFRLQVIQGDVFLKQSETNRLRLVEIPPLRGLIYDRNHKLLVDNYPSYTLLAVPGMYQDSTEYRNELLALIGLSEKEFERRLGRIPGNMYTPVRILQDVPFKLYTALEERKINLPGISFRVQPKRAYMYRIAGHSLGYIGELKEKDMLNYPGLKAGDIVGLSGLEKTYNSYLVGRKGFEYNEVDAMGRIIRQVQGVNSIPAVQGEDLILSLDLDLQLYAEELLDGKSGAIVCIDPPTGEVLAMASKPDYPPETFANMLTSKEWNALRNNPAKPLIHRATQGVYPPGSIFKMAVLASALETKTVTPEWKTTCVGGYQLGNRWFNCWNHAGHGEVNQAKAIEASCDVYFYMVGSMLGIDRFYKYIRHFGFGQKTGIDLPTESEGILPNKKYFDRRYGRGGWSEGVLFNISIGQGEVLVSPLQAADYVSALANGGWWITPHLAKAVIKTDGSEEKLTGFEKHEVGFRQEVIQLVRQDMLRVTEGGHGTARWLYDPRIHVAGKTGSAQNQAEKDHAWFVAFAPFDDPQIAVSVLVEHGEHGSTAAAPIAFKLIRKRLGLDDATWYRYRARILAEQKATADSSGVNEE